MLRTFFSIAQAASALKMGMLHGKEASTSTEKQILILSTQTHNHNHENNWAIFWSVFRIGCNGIRRNDAIKTFFIHPWGIFEIFGGISAPLLNISDNYQRMIRFHCTKIMLTTIEQAGNWRGKTILRFFYHILNVTFIVCGLIGRKSRPLEKKVLQVKRR